MNSQNLEHIKNMDYWSLVNMLLTPITPEARNFILERLLEMNNQLLQPKLDKNFSKKTETLNKEREINLDDIINENSDEHDELDKKLNKIKKLYTKIISEKRQRKKAREGMRLSS